MPDFLSIEVTGNAELRELLRQAAAKLERPRDLLVAIGAVLESNVERRFDSKRDPNGTPWKPLAASTREQYDAADTVKKGRAKGTLRRKGTLLERTGQMRNSLTTNVGEDFVEVGMGRVTDGGAWQLPLLHEFGTSRGLPRRGIFFADPQAGTLGPEDDADVQTELRSFLDDAFGV